MKQFIFSWGFIVLAALFDSGAAFIVKTRFNELGKINFSSFTSIVNYMVNFIKSPFLIFGTILFVLAPIFWFLALNRVEVSVGYPVLVALHLIFITLLAILFLGEPVTWQRVVGAMLILVSLYLLSFGEK
jgi:multidrug transporter EmrE-like cation transporter